jgi:hypothetical protein
MMDAMYRANLDPVMTEDMEEMGVVYPKLFGKDPVSREYTKGFVRNVLISAGIVGAAIYGISRYF